MKRKTLIWTAIFSLILVVASGGAYIVFAIKADESGQSVFEDDTALQTAVARQGNLIVFASGTGRLVAQDKTTLKFDQNGILVQLLVDVGDQVSTGDVLARLQVNISETELNAEIAKAKLEVIKDQQALDTLYKEAEFAAARALYNLETAQQTLVDLQDNNLEIAQAQQAVAKAKTDVEEAEMTLYIHNSSPSEDDIYTAYASLLFKEKTYNELIEKVEQLEYNYKKAKGVVARKRVKAQIEMATAQMYIAQIDYEEALYRYESINDPASPVDLNLAQVQMDTAQVQLNQARLDLADAQLGAPAGEIALAEANVTQAQIEWERWQNGPNPEDILLAETNLEASQLSLLLTEQESLIVELVAPMDGTIMEIHAAVNQTIEGNIILTLADTSQPLVEVYLDETDFESAQVGNRVEVIFDALPEHTFTGSLLEISPSLERSSNSQVVQGLAILENVDMALPVGLNVSVDVIAGEANNVVLVPIEAVHKTSLGSFIVNIFVDGILETRPVNVGLMDFTSAEITAGLEAGEVIALGER